ncbi:MAG: nicotinate (nicotinamide) nucleotide adenylyltransferase [Thermodesulfobacteriota bacterium]|nr:nicotinate (nicotinamide) nucleotide adenylyltransferase [Thermodesulfobacteriota bacterium]|tara:strand:+ start:19952 stop:20602 length:651 start_codon:yes stop_codon:yes gene_type:complete
MRIGIIGGNFNPIHIGHVSMIEEVYESFNLDKLLIVPNSNPHYKETRKIKFELTVDMINLAINKKIDYEISTLESDVNEKHFTLNTLKNISEMYKNDKLIFIIGSDQFLKFETWYKPEEIRKLINIVVPIRTPYFVDVEELIKKNPGSFIRKNYGRKVLLKTSTEKMMIFFDLVNKIDISSYAIKKMFVEDNAREAKKFLPSTVFEYIVKNKIYNL